jgi:hypothetical protein
MIGRILQKQIESLLFSGKAIVVLGPRQSGKTTLIREVLRGKEHLFLNADDGTIRQLLTDPNTASIRRIAGDNRIVFIDEAQRLPEVGLTLKLFVDEFPKLQLVVSGSSALEISQQINEPLTGRKWEYYLFPISWEEYENAVGFTEAERQLEQRLLYGMYPDVINHPATQGMVLQQLTESYLYKDILALANIRKPELLERLLQALALQIGSEVSYNELAQLLGIDKATVMTYIDLLEKSFIVFRIHSFSRNMRNEIKNNRKIYFWDNGVRNMIVANFNPLALRTDKGALWENFIVAERAKYLRYHQVVANRYFWRTVQQQEIDYLEEQNGIISPYEIKWKSPQKVRTPSTFAKAYHASVQTITRDNFRDFAGPLSSGS